MDTNILISPLVYDKILKFQKELLVIEDKYKTEIKYGNIYNHFTFQAVDFDKISFTIKEPEPIELIKACIKLFFKYFEENADLDFQYHPQLPG